MSRTGTTTRDRTGTRRRTPERRPPAPVDAAGPPSPAGPAAARRRRRAAARWPRRCCCWPPRAGSCGPVRSSPSAPSRWTARAPSPPRRCGRRPASRSGTPLLRVDVEDVEARVARLPQIAAVEVTRGWPRSVVITVVERVPVAVVGEAGRRSLVDADGVLFDTITGAPPPGVVPLEVADPGPGRRRHHGGARGAGRAARGGPGRGRQRRGRPARRTSRSR